MWCVRNGEVAHETGEGRAAWTKVGRKVIEVRGPGSYRSLAASTGLWAFPLAEL